MRNAERIARVRRVARLTLRETRWNPMARVVEEIFVERRTQRVMNTTDSGRDIPEGLTRNFHMNSNGQRGPLCPRRRVFMIGEGFFKFFFIVIIIVYLTFLFHYVLCNIFTRILRLATLPRATRHYSNRFFNNSFISSLPLPPGVADVTCFICSGLIVASE